MGDKAKALRGERGRGERRTLPSVSPSPPQPAGLSPSSLQACPPQSVSFVPLEEGADPMRITRVTATPIVAPESAKQEASWLSESLVANPMSIYPGYKDRRSSWGAKWGPEVLVRIKTDDGMVGIGGSAPGAGPADDRAAFRQPARRAGSVQHRAALGPDVPRLPAVWAQGAADHGDQRGRYRPVGHGRQGDGAAGVAVAGRQGATIPCRPIRPATMSPCTRRWASTSSSWRCRTARPTAGRG